MADDKKGPTSYWGSSAYLATSIVYYGWHGLLVAVLECAGFVADLSGKTVLCFPTWAWILFISSTAIVTVLHAVNRVLVEMKTREQGIDKAILIPLKKVEGLINTANSNSLSK